MAEEDAARGSAEKLDRLIVTTGDGVANRRIVKYLAIVRGIVVRAPLERQSFKNTFRSSAEDKLREYAELCETARHDAYVKLVDAAESVGADAVIAMRYDANELVHGASEVVAYGTAVSLAPDGG
jgi:uncharacterized protein YbjQ (UPF0145 family)